MALVKTFYVALLPEVFALDYRLKIHLESVHTYQLQRCWKSNFLFFFQHCPVVFGHLQHKPAPWLVNLRISMGWPNIYLSFHWNIVGISYDKYRTSLTFDMTMEYKTLVVSSPFIYLCKKWTTGIYCNAVVNSGIQVTQTVIFLVQNLYSVLMI